MTAAACRPEVAACYAAIGRQRDPLGLVWDQMKEAERAVIRQSAKVHPASDSHAWAQLTDSERKKLRLAFNRWRVWFQQVQNLHDAGLMEAAA